MDVFKIWASPGESRYSTVVCLLGHSLLVRTSVTTKEVYILKCLLEFGTEYNETRRTKYRRMISQFCRDQLNCLSTNQPKDDRTFRASTNIISCVRARTFYPISVVDDDRYFKNTKSFRPTREVLSMHHIWYD